MGLAKTDLMMALEERASALETLSQNFGLMRNPGESDEQLRQRVLHSLGRPQQEYKPPKYPGFTATINIERPEEGSFEWGELPF